MTDTTIHCESCGEQVTLRRTENRTLRIGCSCTERPLKVSRVLPDEWTLQQHRNTVTPE
jgi:hypothetical protein